MFRFTFECLAALDAVDRAGSFGAAAVALNRVPSAISYSIQKLEADLGLQLLDRSGHRARLTPAGLEVLQRVRRVLDAARALEERADQLASGWEARVRVLVGDVIVRERLLQLVGAFYAAHPGARTRIELESMGREDAWESLQDGRADLLVGVRGVEPTDARIATRRLGDADIVPVIARAHPAAARLLPFTDAPAAPAVRAAVPAAPGAAGAPVGLGADAVGRYRPDGGAACDITPVVALAQWHGPRLRLVRTAGQAIDTLPLSPESLLDELVVDDLDAVAIAVRQGLGVGFLPRALLGTVLADADVAVLEPLSARAVTLALAWRTDRVGTVLAWLLTQLGTPAARQALLR